MLVAAAHQNRERFKELIITERTLHWRKKQWYDEKVLLKAWGNLTRNDARKFFKTITDMGKKSASCHSHDQGQLQNSVDRPSRGGC